MALKAHLVELRNRLFVAAIALLIGAVAGWFLYPWVLDQLTAPLFAAGAKYHRDATINYPTLTGAVDQRVKVSLWLGLIVSSPMWIYQAWAFVTPGLTKRERWYAVGFMAAAVPLFLGGVSLAWFILPNAVDFLIGFAQTDSSSILTSDMYLSFVTRTILAFGVAFLSPAVMVALTMVGLVPARIWLKGWRVAIIIAFAFAAVASPTPDIFTMFALALPMVGLYGGALVVTLIIDRRRARRLALNPDVATADDLDDDEASVLEYRAAAIDADPEPLEPAGRREESHADAT